MFFFKVLLIFIKINLFFCTGLLSSKSILKEVFFREKKIIPTNSYKKISYEFLNEIIGSKKEVIYQLRKIDRLNGYYYKVCYDNDNNIYGYQFFKGGALVSYAKYLYFKNLKLRKIEYFNEKNNLIMSEKMIYDDKKHKIITTERYLPKKINVDKYYD